jgi:hypothetical protein
MIETKVNLSLVVIFFWRLTTKPSKIGYWNFARAQYYGFDGKKLLPILKHKTKEDQKYHLIMVV